METVMNTIVNDLLLPVVLIIVSTTIIIVKSYAKRITDSVTEKNDLDKLERTFAIKKHLLDEIQLLVKSAVASNMQLAESLKADGKYISDEDAKMLSNSAKELILFALPNSITEEDGSLISIIGSREVLEQIIDSMIEKEVYEYKIKSKGNKSNK